MKTWRLTSWQKKPYAQVVNYLDTKAVNKTVKILTQVPPLVTNFEIENLRKQLQRVAEGECFLLQGGDCAESFADCRSDIIADKLKILLQMSLILIHGLRKPVIRIGRIAGQYAKPRSDSTETRRGVTLPSYRGDLINRPEFSRDARTPDPQLMMEAYQRSAMTLNYIRALIDGGFTNLQHPEYWDLRFVQHSPQAEEYKKIAASIANTLDFLKTISGLQSTNVERIDNFFTSHEALHLPYEQALTRKIKNHWYNLSTHLPWIGMRTNGIDGAHVEYARGIANPIGIKVGPTTTPAQLIELINILNPQNESGRLVLIHRFGVKLINKRLPTLIKIVRKHNKQVIWLCDPMHGNTHVTKRGVKTRRFDDILSELRQAFHIHRGCNSLLGGVHFEMTGENVTECIGGARGLMEQDLQDAYKTLCDPRLNYEQALEMAMLITTYA